MEEDQKPVQTVEKPAKKSVAKATKSDCNKYNQQLLKQTLTEVGEVKLMLRTIFAGLKGSFNFDQSLVERVACTDMWTGKSCSCCLSASYLHFLVTNCHCLRVTILKKKKESFPSSLPF